MAKTNAERQKEYRQSRPTSNNGNGEKRLNTWLSNKAGFALARLAAHHGKTQREILEELICQADDTITQGIDLDSAEWETYFSKKIRYAVTNTATL